MPHRRALSFTFAFLRRSPFWSEVWSGTAALLWSVISIIGSGDVTQRPSFLPLGELASVRFWEASGAIMGIGQLTAIAANNLPARWAAAFVLSSWWMLLAVCIAQFDVSAPTWGVYLCYSAANLVSMVRLVGPRV